MKRLLTSILVIVMLATTAMAAPASEDAQWRADDSPAQGHYVQGLSQRKIDALTETTIIKDSKSPTGLIPSSLAQIRHRPSFIVLSPSMRVIYTMAGRFLQREHIMENLAFPAAVRSASGAAAL